MDSHITVMLQAANLALKVIRYFVISTDFLFPLQTRYKKRKTKTKIWYVDIRVLF